MNWFNRNERILDHALQQVRESPMPAGELPSLPSLPPIVSDLLKFAIDLQQTTATQPLRPGFVAEAEKRLLQSLPAKPPLSRPTAHDHREPLHRSRRSIAAAMLAILLAVFSGWGTLSASAAALPGDALYPVKIGAEQAQLALTVSPEENVRLLIKFSDKRIGEIQDLIRLGRSNDIPRALADYEETIREIERGTELLPGNGIGLLPEFQRTLFRQEQLLTELRGKLPPASLSALSTAIWETDHSWGILQKKQSAPGSNQSAKLHGHGPQTQNSPQGHQPTKIKTPRETKNPNSRDTGPEKTPKPKK